MTQPQSPFEIDRAKAEAPPQPWITSRSWVCVGFMVATLLCFGASLLASDTSYVVWAAGGIAGSVLMLIDPIVGLALLVVELKDKHRRAVIWPVLLLCTSGLFVLLAVLAGLAFGG